MCIGNNLNLILNDWKVIDSYLKPLTITVNNVIASYLTTNYVMKCHANYFIANYVADKYIIANYVTANYVIANNYDFFVRELFKMMLFFTDY